ncbi:hypothetical protein ASE36_03400 [Rhizobium sp. Root274]|uniref:ABC transporter permease n=1 Tax=unclassified Rhizobium TaxID=2613769 RepID=UPI000715615F|nr:MULTISPECIES: ABC transporter permease [unclassified Rhizobium]KQW31321.1 hypothetical protein ASC71_03400 [Rhizobium sp. Root1240]KRD32865.1 hypothetical protein ASE36_03400 [Rhizobium sp. Root274]
MKTVSFHAKNNADKGFVDIVRAMLRSAFTSVYAGRSLCFKQISAERTKSTLAPIWDLAEPLLVGLTFVMLYRTKTLQQPELAVPFALFVISGIMAWQSLVDAITIPMKVIISSRELLLNTQVPPEALMWSCLIRALYNLFFKLLIVWGFAISYGHFNLIGFCLSAVYLTAAVFLTASIGFLLSPFNAIAEDTLRVVNLILRPMMFISGVVFPVTTIGTLETINSYNFLFILIENFRSLLFLNFFADAFRITIVTIGLITLFAVGWYVFHTSMRHVSEKV